MQLAASTPCTDTSLGKLLDHVGKLTVFFAGTARKDPEVGDRGGAADAAQLGDDWRTRSRVTWPCSPTPGVTRTRGPA